MNDVGLYHAIYTGEQTGNSSGRRGAAPDCFVVHCRYLPLPGSGSDGGILRPAVLRQWLTHEIAGFCVRRIAYDYFPGSRSTLRRGCHESEFASVRAFSRAGGERRTRIPVNILKRKRKAHLSARAFSR